MPMKFNADAQQQGLRNKYCCQDKWQSGGRFPPSGCNAAHLCVAQSWHMQFGDVLCGGGHMYRSMAVCMDLLNVGIDSG